MQGFAITTAASLEIIAAWVTPKATVEARTTTPGWHVLGEYYLPKTTLAKLDAVHHVSDPALICRVRLWDVTLSVPVGGGVETSSLAPLRQLGSSITLMGDRRYQVQAECIGTPGVAMFSIIETVTITD